MEPVGGLYRKVVIGKEQSHRTGFMTGHLLCQDRLRVEQQQRDKQLSSWHKKLGLHPPGLASPEEGGQLFETRMARDRLLWQDSQGPGSRNPDLETLAGRREAERQGRSAGTIKQHASTDSHGTAAAVTMSPYRTIVGIVALAILLQGVPIVLLSRLAGPVPTSCEASEPVLVLSGGIGEDVVSKVSEAAAMKRWLEDRTALTTEVLLEEVSVSTQTNALRSLEHLLAREGALPSSICLATNSFHRLRARRTFQKALQKMKAGFCAPLHADAAPKTLWSAFFGHFDGNGGSNVEVEEAVKARRELMAIVYYFLLGWLQIVREWCNEKESKRLAKVIDDKRCTARLCENGQSRLRLKIMRGLASSTSEPSLRHAEPDAGPSSRAAAEVALRHHEVCHRQAHAPLDQPSPLSDPEQLVLSGRYPDGVGGNRLVAEVPLRDHEIRMEGLSALLQHSKEVKAVSVQDRDLHGDVYVDFLEPRHHMAWVPMGRLLQLASLGSCSLRCRRRRIQAGASQKQTGPGGSAAGPPWDSMQDAPWAARALFLDWEARLVNLRDDMIRNCTQLRETFAFEGLGEMQDADTLQGLLDLEGPELVLGGGEAPRLLRASLLGGHLGF
eukprot:s3476_g2.t2